MEGFEKKESFHKQISPVDRIKKMLFPAVFSYLVTVGAFGSEASAQTNPETRSTKEIVAAIPAEVARLSEEAKKLERVALDHIPAYTSTWRSPDSIDGVKQEEIFSVARSDGGFNVTVYKVGSIPIEMIDRNNDGRIDEMLSIENQSALPGSSMRSTSYSKKYLISVSPVFKKYQVEDVEYEKPTERRYTGLSLGQGEEKSRTVYHEDNAAFMVRGFQKAFNIALEKISKIMAAEKSQDK